jgi:hypothetical protein
MVLWRKKMRKQRSGSCFRYMCFRLAVVVTTRKISQGFCMLLLSIIPSPRLHWCITTQTLTGICGYRGRWPILLQQSSWQCVTNGSGSLSGYLMIMHMWTWSVKQNLVVIRVLRFRLDEYFCIHFWCSLVCEGPLRFLSSPCMSMLVFAFMLKHIIISFIKPHV